MLSYMAEAQALMRAFVRRIAGSGAPVNGTTGAGDLGIGSEYIDVLTGAKYVNVGTLATPVWTLSAGPGLLKQDSGTITSANITGTGAGQFGHANGVVLVAGQGAHNVVELISVITHYDFSVAAYTGGGNVTVNNSAGGAAITGLVSAANSYGAAADNSDLFVPLAAASTPLVENGGIALVAAAAFTQPGTAAGVIRWICNYRVYATGF